MYHVFVRHFPYQGGSYGLCLLAKYPIINLRNIRLPVMNGDTYSIALLSADIKISRSIVIKTIVAHLDYRNEESRIRQARAIINYCKNTIGPILLMGDFNAPPDSKEIGIVKNDFRDVSAEQFFLTYPDGHPTKKIDYIFFKPPTEWVIKKTQIYHVHASDHLPFQAVLKLRN